MRSRSPSSHELGRLRKRAAQTRPFHNVRVVGAAKWQANFLPVYSAFHRNVCRRTGAAFANYFSAMLHSEILSVSERSAVWHGSLLPVLTYGFRCPHHIRISLWRFFPRRFGSVLVRRVYPTH
jgi:hypothetical protein